MIGSNGLFFLLDGKETPGSAEPGCYLRVYLKLEDGTQQKFNVARAVCEAFHGPPPSDQHTADHKDRDKNNNWSSNLQWSTKREQNLNREVPSVRKDRRTFQTSRTPCFTELVDEELKVENNHYNLTAVQMRESVSRSRHPSGKHRGLRGLYWRYTPDKIMSGENWMPLLNYGESTLKRGYYVSDKGRIRTATGTHGASGKVLEGYLNLQGYLESKLAMVSGGYKTVAIHIAVCETFHGQRPTDKHTPDHKNRNRQDNRAKNLHWATGYQQNLNRSVSLTSEICKNAQDI